MATLKIGFKNILYSVLEGGSVDVEIIRSGMTEPLDFMLRISNALIPDSNKATGKTDFTSHFYPGRFEQGKLQTSVKVSATVDTETEGIELARMYLSGFPDGVEVKKMAARGWGYMLVLEQPLIAVDAQEVKEVEQQTPTDQPITDIPPVQTIVDPFSHSVFEVNSKLTDWVTFSSSDTVARLDLEDKSYTSTYPGLVQYAVKWASPGGRIDGQFSDVFLNPEGTLLWGLNIYTSGDKAGEFVNNGTRDAIYRSDSSGVWIDVSATHAEALVKDAMTNNYINSGKFAETIQDLAEDLGFSS